MLASCNNNKATDNATKADYTPATLKQKGEEVANQEVTIKGKVLHVSYPVGRELTMVDENDSTAIMRIEAGGDVDLFSPSLMGQTITLTGNVKLHKITKEDVARMDSLLAHIDSTKAKMDSLKALGKLPEPPAGDSMGEGPKGPKPECEGEMPPAPREGMEGGHGPEHGHGHGPGHHMNPHKAKFMKEKQDEIKKWMTDNNKDYYPDLYIETIKLSPESAELNKFSAKDSVRLQRYRKGDHGHGDHGHHGAPEKK